MDLFICQIKPFAKLTPCVDILLYILLYFVTEVRIIQWKLRKVYNVPLLFSFRRRTAC